jgi:uncharacterized protein YfdQ (DUF2303 family)
MDPENQSHLISAFVASSNLARPIEIATIPHAIVPEGYELANLERVLPQPKRTRGDFPVVTAEAFNRTVKLLRGTAPAGRLPIFFGRQDTSARVQAVLNFGDWRDLTVTLAQKLSEPFMEWYRLNTRPQTQRAFALFLEERTSHVVKPEGASLLELCRKFKATVTVRFQSHVDDANGDGSLEYLQTSEAGSAAAKQRMKVPSFITLFLPVWHGGAPVKFDARFGYSISDDGKLSLTFEILRLNELLAEELRKIVEAIGQEHPASVVIEGSNASVPNL